MHKTLRDSIALVHRQRLAWRYGNGEALSYGDISQWIGQHTALCDEVRGHCVAVFASTNKDLAKAFPILDGVVSRMLILPPSLMHDKELTGELSKAAGVTMEVTCTDGKITALPLSKALPEKSLKESTEWVLATSGTTDVPKLVVHNLASLTRALRVDLVKGEHTRWGLTYNISRFAGLQVYLQALLSGSELIIPDESDSFSEQLSTFKAAGCTAISATPSFWRKFLMVPGMEALNLKLITLGGEIAGDTILRALKSTYLNATITHIYASTEAGVGFAVSDGIAGFPESYIAQGIGKTKLRLSNTGTLLIKPDTLLQRYLNNTVLSDEEGYIDTGDCVELRNGRVMFLGRDSGAINVGGNKVQPEYIEEVMMASGLIQAARVYAKASPIMGQLVVAEIVADSDDEAETKRLLREYCKKNLESYQIPAMLKQVDNIATNAAGKIVR